MISVVIPTYNEAKWLPRALEMIGAALPDMPHEVLVVDDCSTDSTPAVLAHFHEKFPTIIPITRETRGGTSISRCMGAALAEGDTLCFLDAHVYPDPGFFDLLYEAAWENPGSIVSPGLTQHKLTDPWTEFADPRKGTNYGGGFTFACRKHWFYMSVNKKPRHWQRRKGSYACGMTMTRELYDHLGGWIRLPGFWSSSDVALCMKAWYMDVPIIIETEAHHYHGIKGFGPHETPKWHEVINRMYAARVIFSPECYSEFWMPAFMERFGCHWSDEFPKYLESPTAQGEHDAFRAKIKFTDEEFLEANVYPRLDKAGLLRKPVIE